jgi:hypothetical protein
MHRYSSSELQPQQHVHPLCSLTAATWAAGFHSALFQSVTVLLCLSLRVLLLCQCKSYSQQLY